MVEITLDFGNHGIYAAGLAYNRLEFCMFRHQVLAVFALFAAACSQPASDKPAAATTESDTGSAADIAAVETNNPADIAAADATKVETVAVAWARSDALQVGWND